MASRSHVWSPAPSTQDDSPRSSPKTKPSREIQEDRGVGHGETARHRVAVIPVNDPDISCELCGQLRLKLLFGRLDPIGSPIQAVKMHDRQPSRIAKRACERGFTRRRTAENQNSLHCFSLKQMRNWKVRRRPRAKCESARIYSRAVRRGILPISSFREARLSRPAYALLRCRLSLLRAKSIAW